MASAHKLPVDRSSEIDDSHILGVFAGQQIKAFPQHAPRFGLRCLLFRPVVGAFDAVLLQMISAKVCNVGQNPKLHHERGSGPSQIMWRPGAAREQQGAGQLAAIFQRFGPLAIADLLGDGFLANRLDAGFVRI